MNFWMDQNKQKDKETEYFLTVDDKESNVTSLVLVHGKIKVSGNEYFILWSRYPVSIKVTS